MYKKFTVSKYSDPDSCMPKIVRIMKLTTLLLVIAIMHTTAATLAQRVTIKAERSSLKQIFKEIKKQTAYDFLYKPEDLELSKPITIDVEDVDLRVVLEKCFSDQPLTYSLNQGVILISKKDMPAQLVAVPIHVSGHIADENGTPMQGVNVLIKGTVTGVSSNVQGDFNITVPDKTAILVFSFIGYEKKEILVGNQIVVNVSMVPTAAKLTDVVVIGYGSVKKSDLTGSVSSISDKEIQQSFISSPEQALQGRVAGLQLTQSSGAPGGNNSIRIRGTGSLTSSNEPLFVIDGFPISGSDSNAPGPFAPGTAPAGTFTQGSDPLTTINPNDILSIEVLKDASATAIYGSRGSNGVIIITTKRGRNGKTKIDFSSYTGVSNVTKKLQMADAGEYWEFLNAFLAARSSTGQYAGIPTLSPLPLSGDKFIFDKSKWLARFGNGTDWQDQIFRTGVVADYALSISGGNSSIKYSVSGDYLNQKGVVLNSDLKRYAARINLDATATPTLTIGSSVALSRTSNTQIATNSLGNSADVIYNTLVMPSIVPPRDSTGAPVKRANIWDSGPTAGSGIPGGLYPPLPTLDNPAYLAQAIINNSYGNRVLANVFGEYKILNNLKFRTSFGVDYQLGTRDFWIPSDVAISRPTGISSSQSYASKSESQSITLLNENYLTFDQKLTQKLNMNLVGGFSTQKNNSESLLGSGANFTQSFTKYNNVNSGSFSSSLLSQSSASAWSLESFYIRSNFNYGNKYLLTLTGRTDGSSRFAINDKWGFFPSGAFAWRMSEEQFMKTLNVFSNFKWRLSYGVTGNFNIGNYAFASLLNNVAVPMGSTGGGPGVLATAQSNAAVGYYPGNLGNNNLKWERNEGIDLGADIGIVHDRIQLTVDFYNKTTKDLLYNVSIPAQSGYTSALVNIGSIRNRGLELALTTTNIQSGSFTWTTNANIAFNKNTLLSINGQAQSLAVNLGTISNLLDATTTTIAVGQPIGEFYGYKQIGWINNTAELASVPVYPGSFVGARRFQDTNGDGKITPDDMVSLGNAQPSYTYGFTNNISYRGIDLSIFFQGVQGNKVFNLTRVKIENDGGGRENKPADYPGNFWTPTNPNAKYGIPGTNQPRVISDAFIEDGSFLRIKNINLGYNLPQKLLTKTFIRAIKVYVSATNLYTFTKYTGYDPEVNSLPNAFNTMGVDRNSYPNVRAITFGLNLGL